MKYPVFAIIISMMIASSSHAFAQSVSAPSTDVIMQRLDALDKRNDALDKRNAKLESENAALRDRVRLLEVGKRNTATAASPTTQPPNGAAAMAMTTSSSGVAYKAPNLSPLVAYNWTGFYVGAHLGGGLAQKQWIDLDQSSPLGSPDVGSHKATGLLGGIQGGYNWQIGHLVLGVEGQYSFANLSGDHQNTSLVALDSTDINTGTETVVLGTQADRFSTRVDGIATIAGRIGFASDPIDRTLFYATGGAAFAKDKYTLQTGVAALECVTPSGGSSTCSPVGGYASLNGSQNRWGWMVGAGLEHGLTENWSAKIEYNYLDFGTKTISLQGTGCFSVGEVLTCAPETRNFNVNQNIQLIKLGINYRFNGGDH
jgi:outer membrane immunogenic protein